MKLKDKIIESVDAIRSASNALRASDYGRVFFWQEVSSLSEKKLKASWVALQDSKLQRTDDDMRGIGEGEHILASDKRFVVVAKVSKAQERFDLETFIAKVAKKHKIDATSLLALAESSKKSGTRSLSKRVLEKE